MLTTNALAANMARSLILCAAITLGTAATAQAASPMSGPAEIQKCVAKLHASGRSSGTDSETSGLTEYDVMVGRCMPRSMPRTR